MFLNSNIYIMKYVKTYEALDKKFKKFLIITNDTYDDYDKKSKFYIVKNVEIYARTAIMNVNFLFRYNDEHNYGPIPRREGHFNLSVNNLNVLYQSNTYKECIDMMSFVANTNKYNI